jgi:hypothetical protein
MSEGKEATVGLRSYFASVPMDALGQETRALRAWLISATVSGCR